MANEKRLIELLESAESAVYWNSSDKGFIEKIADHLIANGVTIPVRCEDCKRYHTMSPYGGVIYKFPICQEFRCNTKTTDFCSYGERKDNEKDRGSRLRLCGHI